MANFKEIGNLDGPIPSTPQNTTRKSAFNSTDEKRQNYKNAQINYAKQAWGS